MSKGFGRLMSILHRQSQIYLNYSLKEYNITSAEYAFLLCLYVRDGMTQDELSSYLYIDKSATARSVKSLEDKGYVVKEKDNDDKRCNRIYLTDKARLYKDEIRHRIWSWSNFLTDDIPEDTIETVLAVLKKMVAKVERTDLRRKLEES